MKYLAFIPLLLIVTLIFLPHQSDAKPNQVIEDIRALAESELDAQLKEAQFEQAPDYISIRAYKFERILEVWAGLSDSEPLRLLKRYEICAWTSNPAQNFRKVTNARRKALSIFHSTQAAIIGLCISASSLLL